MNAFLEVFEAEALDKARELDDYLTTNFTIRGRLFGVVIGIKDVICYKGHRVSAASRMLEQYISSYHSTAVERLLAEDAIIIGRLNCDEFAMGSSNENSAFGKVLNELDPTRVPGGSSGGSAVAVQSGCCMLSLGSDTGGSVRQPADHCGIIGLKPSYGLVSRHGLIAYASSFDQIGVLGTDIDDLALTLDVIAGPDEFDSTATDGILRHEPSNVSSASFAPVYELGWNMNGGGGGEGKDIHQPGLGWNINGGTSEKSESNGPWKFAYFRQALEHPSLDPEIRTAIYGLMEDLRFQGHEVDSIEFDYLDYVVPTYYVLTTAEASSNLSRFDGARYGYRAEGAASLEEMYKKSRSTAFGAEVKRRIMLGTFVLSAGYYDAYFTKAQQVRRLLVEKTQKVFHRYDALLMPTVPSPAFHFGEKSDPVSLFLTDIYTVFANLVGIPAISLPLFSHSSGMPFGLQVLSSFFREAELLCISQNLLGAKPGKTVV